jgi:hypothetical protein
MVARTSIRMAAVALLLIAAAAPAAAQTVFKIPFPFQAGGKKLQAGDYAVLKTADGSLALRQEASGKETPLPFTERLAQPKPALTGPQVVFDEVGDFVPSYTEYITVYIVSEVWWPGEDGYRTHTTKGAHKIRIIKAVGGQQAADAGARTRRTD